ncbi:MAG: LysR family transcriptional regulator [Gammaproteobacteria bacterium]|nr:LysR family transcriptional regulator [Gammaproteobacteria bacterium]
MNVTFRQIKVFQAVARSMSYTEAAKKLHLSQPAVSMQVKQLEENIGLPLFEQMGKKIYMTDAGNEFYVYAQEITRLLDEADAVFEEMKGVHGGKLTVSVATTANYFATRLLANFAKQHEGITISLDVTNREVLLKRITQNETDMVIMGRPPEDMELETEVFMDNPLVVIAPPDHPLVKEKEIPFKRMQQETFVVREQGSGTRIAMERFFAEEGVRLTTGMEMTSNEAIKQAVEAGLGLGIVSIHTLELELETNHIKVLDVEMFPIMRHWYVVYRKGKRLSPVAQAFREFVLEEGPNLMIAGR